MMSTRPEIAEFLKALDETQYLSPARLQAYQRRLLGRLLTMRVGRPTSTRSVSIASCARTAPSIGTGGWSCRS